MSSIYSLEKKACEQIYSETENYYRINIITKEKNKKYIINIFKYYARLLDYDISINSLAPIYSDFNELINKNDIDHKIREVSYDILDEYFNTSSIARIQIIYVLSLLLTRYTDIQEVHQFMKNTNLKLQLNKVNFIDHYYLNNQILSKKLLSYGEHMEIQSEIVINSNYDILRLDNNDGIKANQLLFFRMNDNNMNNPKQIITGIYFMIDNEVCFINKELDTLNLLEKIIK